MKSKSIAGVFVGAVALVALFGAPQPSSGQAGRTEEQVVAQLVAEVFAQQKAIMENQTLLEEKTALVAEEVRIARIYASRIGGKGGAK